MKKAKWRTYLFWIILCEAVGLLAGVLSRDGIEKYAENTVQIIPIPAAVFPIVWAILYALMGIGMARVRLNGGSGGTQNLFVAQLIVNFFWPLIFFNARAFGLAFAWLLLLWVLVLSMTLAFSRQDSAAGWLQVPYLVWLTIAAFLNYTVWQMN